MNLKAIIVDDEKDSRDTLRHYLNTYCKDVKVLGMAENGEEAFGLIKENSPDLVFLDIEMPFGTGFDLLDRFEEVNFEVIFVTAYSEYAIEAIKRSAASYILKPISIDELIDAVEKIKKKIHAKDDSNYTRILLDNIREIKAQNQKIVLPGMDGFDVVRVSEILYCTADDNFTSFHFKDGSKALICRSLKYYENILANLGFQRIHRSIIVNLEYVAQYRKGKGGFVVLENGAELEVAQSRKKAFLKRFS
ncbi:MAG: response regulator transcription factor [Bacteroidetes bacterium]|nr:response regulator transcription factor [Bacteroidota bacterium]